MKPAGVEPWKLLVGSLLVLLVASAFNAAADVGALAHDLACPDHGLLFGA